MAANGSDPWSQDGAGLAQDDVAVRLRFWSEESQRAEAERRLVARELHDSAETVSALLMRCRALEVSVKEPAQRQELRSMMGELDGCVRELMRVARGLYPMAVDELGLEPALRQLSQALLATRNIAVELAVELDDGLLTRELRALLYRSAQEALQNVARHASAQRVHIACVLKDGLLALRVKDDGRGGAAVSPTFSPSKGGGLRGLRERLMVVGGELSVARNPDGAGSLFEVLLPLSG